MNVDYVRQQRVKSGRRGRLSPPPAVLANQVIQHHSGNCDPSLPLTSYFPNYVGQHELKVIIKADKPPQSSVRLRYFIERRHLDETARR